MSDTKMCTFKINAEKFANFKSKVALLDTTMTEILNDMIDGFLKDEDIPNRETLEAIKECENLARDPNVKKYNSFEELAKEQGWM